MGGRGKRTLRGGADRCSAGLLRLDRNTANRNAEANGGEIGAGGARPRDVGADGLHPGADTRH